MNERTVDSRHIKDIERGLRGLRGRKPVHWSNTPQHLDEPVMSAENTTFQDEEAGENLPPHIGPFLAGFFEVGGHMGIHVSNESGPIRSDGTRKPLTRIRPVINYSDTRIEKLRILQGFFGGSVLPDKRKQNSHTWSIRDNGALEIADHIAPWVVWRSEVVTAFQNYRNANSPEEALAIAQASKDKKTYPPVENYGDVINNPAFLAGIFESRGTFASPNEIRFHTKNRDLLEAIRQTIGGRDISESDVDGYSQYSLSLPAANTRTLVSTIEPYLISPFSIYKS